MRKSLFLILFLFNVAYADVDVIPEFSEETLPVLNEQLRQLDVDEQIKEANKLDLHSKKIINLATPTANTDGATKAYVDTSVSALGAWDVTPVQDTIYQASTDGFVIAYYSSGAGTGYILTGLTDSANPPTTIRITQQADAAAGLDRVGIMFPVRKNDYWQVTISAGTITDIAWIPLD